MDRRGEGRPHRRCQAARAIAVLTLDAAGEGGSAGLVEHGAVLAALTLPAGRGSVAALPALAREVLQAARSPLAVAVTVGPGSFTGLRAALALAHGLGLGFGVPVLGVGVGDAVRALHPEGRPVWVAMRGRPGRVLLDDGATVASSALDALPLPHGPIALAGEMAAAVASRLAARGCDVQLLALTAPTPAGIAAAAARWPRPPLPAYVEEPVARPNAAARPAPIP